jgi:uncharacterized protein YndB with AHSA1/START domain
MTNDEERALTLTRELAAPVARVWSAITEPAQLARWWGPVGFRAETHAHELRPGGVWRLTLHGPDGRTYENLAVFDEVSPPGRLVLRAVGEPGVASVRHVTTLVLEPLGAARTRLTMTLTFPTAAERDDASARYGADEGLVQTVDRLAAWLHAPAPEGFVIRRVLRATPARVWAAWTDVAELRRWFHPASWVITSAELDLRVGGTFFYSFAGEGLPETWAIWRFTAVEPTRRLAFDLSFARPDRALGPSPFGGPWPARLATEVTIAPHAGIGGGVALTVAVDARDASAAELAAFHEAFEGMNVGWGETLDSLVAHLPPGRPNA